MYCIIHLYMYYIISFVHVLYYFICTKVGGTQAAYEGSCNGGLHMIDVSDPLNPVFAGCYADDGYVHDTQCVIYHGPDTRYQVNKLLFIIDWTRVKN